MTSETRVPLVIAAGALVTTGLFVTEAGPPLQSAAAITFLLVGPGLAWVRLARLGDRMTEWTVAVVASLGIAVAVATALLTTGLWTPGRALGVIVGVTIIGSVADAGSVTIRPWAPICGGVARTHPGKRRRAPGRHRTALFYVAIAAVILVLVSLVALLLPAIAKPS